MQVMVTFRHVEPTDVLRQYAEDKLQRVHKFLRRPIEAHVILSVVKRRHVAEVQISANHLNLTATEETGDLYSAIDLAMSKLERQIKKHVAKHKAHKGADTAATADALGAAGERTGRVLRTQRVAVKPMSVDEAVIHLGMQKGDFLLFKNAANETLSVIYRRKDGNYGLIEPEPS
ncbi:MAG: ribosome hibernation-promoting factor, HPF/YfiA family [Candidatus Binatia bacterium]